MTDRRLRMVGQDRRDQPEPERQEDEKRARRLHERRVRARASRYGLRLKKWSRGGQDYFVVYLDPGHGPPSQDGYVLGNPHMSLERVEEFIRFWP